MTYCEFASGAGEESVHKLYHDQAYGFPINDDNELFGRLVLEINQAGLSWTTILKKENNFRAAYNDFNIKTVAGYGDREVARLLSDAGIIRNRLKVAAAIHNARVIVGLQSSHGSFKVWLDMHHPKEKVEWVKLFKQTFKFTGGEIVNEFLMSTGYLPGAHDESCRVYQEVLRAKPAWRLKENKALNSRD
jgi:DNA-3-methyladenine glycosylase I